MGSQCIVQCKAGQVTKTASLFALLTHRSLEFVALFGVQLVHIRCLIWWTGQLVDFVVEYIGKVKRARNGSSILLSENTPRNWLLTTKMKQSSLPAQPCIELSTDSPFLDTSPAARAKMTHRCAACNSGLNSSTKHFNEKSMSYKSVHNFWWA